MKFKRTSSMVNYIAAAFLAGMLFATVGCLVISKLELAIKITHVHSIDPKLLKHK